MKNIITIILFLSANIAFSQNINWATPIKNNKSLVYLNFGYDFGVTTQIGYAKMLNTKRPIMLLSDFSRPMGNDILDDFKLRVGGQAMIYEMNSIKLSTKLFANLRRHQTSLVRMASFGAEASLTAGYYKPRWHVAAEFGFDKSIANHLKNSESLVENYPDIQDGWLISSGGQYFYGVQLGKNIGQKIELSLRIGGTNAQSDHENALLPNYTQVGLVYKLGRKNQ